MAAQKVQLPQAPMPAKELALLIKLSLQADQITREAGRVLSGTKRGVQRSVFGKIARAGLQEKDGKLSTKIPFQCDRYEMKSLGDPAQAAWKREIREVCGRIENAKTLAVWTFDSDLSARVEIRPSALSEVLGMAASIFGKNFTCQLTWSEGGLLQKLDCPGWSQDHSSSLHAKLDLFRYERGAGEILKMKGHLLEQFEVRRKFEASVPLEGKISVVETEAMPPPGSAPAKGTLIEGRPTAPPVVLPTVPMSPVPAPDAETGQVSEDAPISADLIQGRPREAGPIEMGVRRAAPLQVPTEGAGEDAEGGPNGEAGASEGEMIPEEAPGEGVPMEEASPAPLPVSPDGVER